jgi:hypothetical protein
MFGEGKEVSREEMERILQEYSGELFVNLNYRLLMDSSNREDEEGRILWVDSLECSFK